MQVTVEDVSQVKKTIHVEVPEEDVTRELDAAYGELKKNAKVKGFRKGKAPRSILERMFGKSINDEVRGKLISESLQEAIAEIKLNILGSPDIDPPELEGSKAYKYNFSVEVKPEFGDIDFKGLTLTKKIYKASNEEVEQQIKMLQKQMAQAKVVEEKRPAQKDDLLLIDYEGLVQGKAYEETPKIEGETLKLGEGKVLKEFEENLEGMKAGESKEFTVNFPDDYLNKKMAGKEILFKLTLREIRKEILPEIDDEFAKDVGEYENLDALKASIMKSLKEGYDKRTEQELAEEIFKALIEKTDFELPEILVEHELNTIVQDTEKRLSYQNMTLEDIGMTREIFSEKYKEIAEKQVRRQLILDRIIEQENMTVSDEELEAEYQKMSESIDKTVEEIREIYNQNKNGLEFFKHAMMEKKAVQTVIDAATVEEVEAQAETSPETSE